MKLFQHDFTLNAEAERAGQGVEARFCKPCDLRLDAEGQISDEIGPLQQFALECKQEELLAMDRRVLETMIRKCRYLAHLYELQPVSLAALAINLSDCASEYGREVVSSSSARNCSMCMVYGVWCMV